MYLYTHPFPVCLKSRSDPIFICYLTPLSVKIAEEKLRYAAYNCVAIDADMSPWDE